jgi:hypothetical protein
MKHLRLALFLALTIGAAAEARTCTPKDREPSGIGAALAAATNLSKSLGRGTASTPFLGRPQAARAGAEHRAVLDLMGGWRDSFAMR